VWEKRIRVLIWNFGIVNKEGEALELLVFLRLLNRVVLLLGLGTSKKAKYREQYVPLHIYI